MTSGEGMDGNRRVVGKKRWSANFRSLVSRIGGRVVLVAVVTELVRADVELGYGHAVVVDLFGRAGNTVALPRNEGRIKGKGGGGARQELKDEDMHINRETSTEMSDHRWNEPTFVVSNRSILPLPPLSLVPISIQPYVAPPPPSMNVALKRRRSIERWNTRP